MHFDTYRSSWNPSVIAVRFKQNWNELTNFDLNSINSIYRRNTHTMCSHILLKCHFKTLRTPCFNPYRVIFREYNGYISVTWVNKTSSLFCWLTSSKLWHWLSHRRLNVSGDPAATISSRLHRNVGNNLRTGSVILLKTTLLKHYSIHKPAEF